MPRISRSAVYHRSGIAEQPIGRSLSQNFTLGHEKKAAPGSRLFVNWLMLERYAFRSRRRETTRPPTPSKQSRPLGSGTALS